MNYENHIFDVFGTTAFLVSRILRAVRLSLRKANGLKWVVACYLLAAGQKGFAYTVVQPSTSAPAGLEAQFIAATTAQFQANLTTNPFFPGTFGIQLLGQNPTYNPPVKDKDLLNSLVSVDSYTYVAGWANGESYQEFKQWNVTAQMGTLCGSATNFALIQATTATFNRSTCQDVVGTIANMIFQLQSDTPTLVPGMWQ